VKRENRKIRAHAARILRLLSLDWKSYAFGASDGDAAGLAAFTGFAGFTGFTSAASAAFAFASAAATALLRASLAA
jgi:hypothetical protein